MKKIIKGGGAIKSQIEKDKVLEIEQEARKERAKARNTESKEEQGEADQQIKDELNGKEKTIGKAFIDKGDKMQKKKNKKLDMSEEESCKDKDGQKITSNCCDSDNLSTECNSSSGTTKHIFEMIYPDIRAALLAVGVAGKFTDTGYKLFTEKFPKTIIFDPYEAEIEYKSKLKAMETLGEIKAAQEYLVGGKQRKYNRKNRKGKKSKKYVKKSKKQSKKTRKTKKKYNKKI